MNEVNIRAKQTAEGKRFLVGYAALFDKPSNPLLENGVKFIEVIRYGAFSDILALQPDVILCLNHDHKQLLARTSNGSLVLSQDAKGLKFTAELPNTYLADETFELVKNRTRAECSFAFTTPSDGWDWIGDYKGLPLREVRRVSGLYDVSIVTRPAYSGAEVGAFSRSTLLEVAEGYRGMKDDAEKRLRRERMLLAHIEHNRRREVIKRATI